MLRLTRRYVTEVHTILDNPHTFAVQYAEALAMASLMEGLCPDIYASDSYPFKKLRDLSTVFSFDGFLPGGMGEGASTVPGIVAEGEMKLLGWSLYAGGVG